MSNNHQPATAAQIERRKVAQARREQRDKFWSIIMMVIIVVIVSFVIAVQISHHI